MKKIIGILACSSLLLSSMNVFAQTTVLSESAGIDKDETVEKKENVPTSERLEDVIKKVKPLLDVPEEYSSFSWRFSAGSYYSRPCWFFTWTDNETGEISVKCGNDGKIFSYNEERYDDELPASVPEETPKSLEKVARDFIAKILPYTSDSEFVLTSTTNATVHRSTYGYEFTRYENGIPVPDNTVSVSVNYKTKKAENLTCNFNSDITFDKTAPTISAEKAKEILGENQKMSLSYRLDSQYDDKTGDLISKKAYLVYTPEVGYISVDAYTGKVYTERNTWTVNDSDFLKSESSSMSGGSGGSLFNDMKAEEKADDGGYRDYELTEKELEELSVLESLITKDEAIAVITKNDKLCLDESATAIEAHLSKYYDESPIIIKNDDGTETTTDKYVWNISFYAPDSGDENAFSYRTNATVNANDGTLIDFSAQTPNYRYYSQNKIGVPEIKISDDEAEKAAKDFIKALQPEKFENIRLSDSYDYSVILYKTVGDGESIPVYGNKRFYFTRVNEGIDFGYNSFSVSVSLLTGKITSYSFNWDDNITFESPKDVISPEKALESFYSYDGFGLNYEINSNYTYNKYLAEKDGGEFIDYDDLYKTENYSRPVYSAYNPGTTIIRAKDGVMITGSGKEYKKDNGFYYSDIDGHWIKDTAERLGYIGIGFDSDSLNPNEKITADELNKLLRKARIYGYKKDFDLSGESITRADTVKYIISALGYKKVAQLENVFIADFADISDLKKEDVGFIAIAKGFGIIDGDGSSFRPYEDITRAESLSLIAKVLSAGLID